VGHARGPARWGGCSVARCGDARAASRAAARCPAGSARSRGERGPRRPGRRRAPDRVRAGRGHRHGNLRSAEPRGRRADRAEARRRRPVSGESPPGTAAELRHGTPRGAAGRRGSRGARVVGRVGAHRPTRRAPGGCRSGRDDGGLVGRAAARYRMRRGIPGPRPRRGGERRGGRPRAAAHRAGAAIDGRRLLRRGARGGHRGRLADWPRDADGIASQRMAGRGVVRPGRLARAGLVGAVARDRRGGGSDRSGGRGARGTTATATAAEAGTLARRQPATGDAETPRVSAPEAASLLAGLVGSAQRAGYRVDALRDLLAPVSRPGPEPRPRG
jgi:hypothetical protein